MLNIFPSSCILNRNPTEAASRLCIVKPGNLSDSFQMSFISFAYYYMCVFQSTTHMELAPPLQLLE